MLVDGESTTQLTLAGDKDLVYLKAGDAVKQNNSPVTPTTSAITNVATVEYTSGATASPSAATSLSDGFDGDVTTAARTVPGDPNNITIIFTPPINVTSSVEIIAGVGSGDSAYCTIDGTSQPTINCIENNTSFEW